MENFNKEEFSKILLRIKDTYASLNQMAEKTGVTSAYLSKLIRLMYKNPPSLEIIKKIADNSNNVTDYEELMHACGYIDDSLYKGIQAIRYLEKNDPPMQVYKDFRSAIDSLSLDELKNFIKNNMCSLKKEQLENMLLLQESSIKIALQEDKNINKKESNIILNNLKECLKLLASLEQPTSNVLPIPSNKLYMCPVYGRIAAGVPNWAEQCMEGTLPLDPYMMNIHNPEECFFLRVSGESMNKVIKNGGYALIRKQDEVDNGDIAVVLVNGYDATLKKFTRKNDTIVLEPMSDDESIGIQIYDCTTQIKILGKYIGKFELN